MGGTRDIPPGATIHYSVLERMKLLDKYRPTNDVNVARTAPSDAVVKSLAEAERDIKPSTPYKPILPAQSWWEKLLVSLRLQKAPEPLPRVYWHEHRGKKIHSDDGSHRMTDTTYTISLDPPSEEQEPEQMPVVKRPKYGATNGHSHSHGHSSNHEHSSNHTYTTSSTTYEYSSGQGGQTKHSFSSSRQGTEGRSFL